MSSKRTSNGPQPQVVVSWSHDEDKCLARAWCTFRDGFKDTDPRKIEEFWGKVATHYNENRPAGTELRSWDAVNTHCFHMMLDVNLLSKVYETCDMGQSVDDVLEVALAQWRNKYSKDFKYAHVWKLMTELEIDRPQQSDQDQDHRANKKSRTSEWKLRTELEIDRPQQPDQDHRANKKSRMSEWKLTTGLGINHPQYQQSDHRANKKSRTSESCSRTSSESEVRFCAIEQPRARREDEMKVKACAIGNRGKKRQQIQEEKMKQKEIKLMHKDFDIVMMDTNGMTDAQRQVHRKFVEQIRARRNW